MPIRDDATDLLRYMAEAKQSFDSIREILDASVLFADAVKNIGIESDKLASYISGFMSQLNKEFFEEDPTEEVSFDEVMGFFKTEEL